MVSDTDLATASIIAILILIIIVCIWPGLARVRGSALAGYWVAPNGSLYEIRDAGGRSFTVIWALDKPPQEPGRQTAVGKASGVRGVTIAALGKRGHVELGGRLISWKGGDSWTRQGLKVLHH